MRPEIDSRLHTMKNSIRPLASSVARFLFPSHKRYSILRFTPLWDGVKASDTDAKRMLEAYIGYTLNGSSYEKSRRHARAAFELANELQHKRTATFREA